MPTRKPAVHVVTTQRRYKDRVYTTHLLRRSYREDGKVRNTTVGNLSHLNRAGHRPRPPRAPRRDPGPGRGGAAGAALAPARARRLAVLGTLRALGLDRLLGARRSRERDLCLALVAARVLAPGSKLGTARTLDAGSATSTLGEELGLETVAAEDLYAAMDWLGQRQARIEQALARRHLQDGDAGALRRLLELPRGAVLPTRAPRPLARREEGQAADRLRAAVQRRGVRRWTVEVYAIATPAFPADAGGPDPQGPRPLRPGARSVRRRPGDADERAHRRGAPPGRGAGLGLGAPQQRRSPGWRATGGRCSRRCSTRATWPRSATRTSPASA